MSPTEKQKELIYTIASEIKSWSRTNDISSPSHWTLIEEFVKYEIDPGLNVGCQDRLMAALAEIMTVVRMNK